MTNIVLLLIITGVVGYKSVRDFFRAVDDGDILNAILNVGFIIIYSMFLLSLLA